MVLVNGGRGFEVDFEVNRSIVGDVILDVIREVGFGGEFGMGEFFEVGVVFGD